MTIKSRFKNTKKNDLATEDSFFDLFHINSTHQLAGSSALWFGTGKQTAPLTIAGSLRDKKLTLFPLSFSFKKTISFVKSLAVRIYQLSFIYMLVLVLKAPSK